MRGFTTGAVRSWRKASLPALLVCFVAAPASAATLHVEVVDEYGAAVGRPIVYLQRAGGDSALGDPFRRYRRLNGNAQGRAEFDGLQPGHYVVGARTSETPRLDEEDNPLSPRARFTVDTADQVVEVRLELQRGTQLCARFVIEGSRLDARGSVWRKELESGYSTEKGLRREEEHCEQFFTGRWELGLKPPGGYVLVDLDVNGVSTTGNTVVLDIRAGTNTQHVTWYLVALARLEGKVHFEGDSFGVVIRADLLQGGQWLAEAEARGGSLYAPVQARPDSRTGYYAVDLPDGRWRIQPTGDGLEESEPAVVEVDIARGEQYRQDFTVRGESSGYQPGLRVRVQSPAGDRVPDAVVELWPADSARRGEVPLASERTQRWGTARIRDLQPGTYLLVAGHSSFREASRTIVFDPEDDDTRSRSIRLERAASLNVRLASGEEQDLSGGAIELIRIDEQLDTQLADEKLLRELRRPRARFDATNRAWVPGIYAGTYRVTGVHDRLLFEFERNGRWIEEPEIEFADGQSRELEARVVAAGTVAGNLYCTGGEPLPGNATVRIVAAGARPVDPLDLAWEEQVVLEREPLLKGEHKDAFEVGPLTPSTYLVALKPATFERWTWVYGTENGAEAQDLQVRRGEALPLGAIAVECGPVVRATISVRSGRDAPDLTSTRWKRDLLLRSTVVTQEGRRHELEQADLERYERLLILRGFREGELQGELSLRHDYFVPDPWVRVPLNGELTRGGKLDVTVPVEDVGGAVELSGATSATVSVRLIDPAGTVRTELLEDGKAYLPNLPVGTYELQRCADDACSRLSREPETIEVEPLRTLKLRRSPRDS